MTFSRAILILFLFVNIGCEKKPTDEVKPTAEVKEDKKSETKTLTLYTHRHYEADQKIIGSFTKKTGIVVNVVNASADELLAKIEREGAKSPADVFLTADVARLVRAQEKGFLAKIDSEKLKTNIPAHLRDAEGSWFALTKRARVVVYAKDRVKPEEITTYADLTSDKWKKKILVRSSSNIYNQSLLAAYIAHFGKEKAKTWAEGIVANMARTPKGNDRDQVKAVAAGIGDIAIINTYYLGKLLNSKDETERKAGEAVGIVFPDMEKEGAKPVSPRPHINISGAAVLKTAPHKKEAIAFIEFLSDVEAQNTFSAANYEYPVNPKAETNSLLTSWGAFEEDKMPLKKLGTFNKDAVIIFDQVGWK